VDEYKLAGLFFSFVLILSIRRSKKKLKTFLLSMAIFTVVSFLVLLSILFLPVNNAPALGHLATDTGRMAGTLAAVFYSGKTRENSPRSV